MKKTPYALLAGFILICSLCSAIVTGLYPQVEFTPSDTFEDVDYDLRDSIAWLILGKVQELNPEYQFIDSKNSALVDQVREQTRSYIRESAYLLDNDENFSYKIEWKDQVVQNHFDEDTTQENALFYGELIYDQNGNLKENGNMTMDEFGFLSISYFHSLSSVLGGITQSVDPDVVLIPPQDVKVTLFIPKEMKTKSGFVYNCVYNNSTWEPYVIFSMMIGSVVIALYIVLASWRKLAQVQPFQTILSWKAEFNVVFLTGMTSLLMMICVYLLGLTISDVLETSVSSYGIPNAGLWINIVNFFMFFLTLFFVGLDVYYAKYALCSGFVRFLKEDCWIGNQIVALYGGIKNLSYYDLDHKVKQLILKAVILNTVLMFLCSLFWGWLLVLIYGVVSYLFLLHQADKIIKEYDKLLMRMDRIAQGDFKVDQASQTPILLSLQEKLDTLQDDFEDAIKERVRSQNLKTELITNVSHDLKTPLTGIKSYLELLNDPNLKEEDKEEYLHRINQYTDRLSKLIEDLFEVSKANSGNIDLNAQKIDIVSLVEQVLVENETMLQKKGLLPVLRKSEEPVECILDGDKTVRIFENLLSNVAKYALENTRVFVKVEKQNDGVDIIIQNISKTPLDFDPQDITERFVRADQSRHEEGSGLGLAIVKSFCEIQNGGFKVCLDGDVFKAIVHFPIKKINSP